MPDEAGTRKPKEPAGGRVRKAVGSVENRRTALIRAIEREIISGRLRPGERLDERRLAEKFGVSRTPIREALARLTSAGLLESHHHRGTFVASLDFALLLEASETAQEVESACARLAARRMTSEQREELCRIVQDAMDAESGLEAEAYADHNLRFHGKIYEGAHNRFLADIALNARMRVAPFRAIAMNQSGHSVRSIAEHKAIADAICEGRADDAAALMRHHDDIHRHEYADALMHFAQRVTHSSS